MTERKRGHSVDEVTGRETVAQAQTRIQLIEETLASLREEVTLLRDRVGVLERGGRSGAAPTISPPRRTTQGTPRRSKRLAETHPTEHGADEDGSGVETPVKVAPKRRRTTRRMGMAEPAVSEEESDDDVSLLLAPDDGEEGPGRQVPRGEKGPFAAPPPPRTLRTGTCGRPRSSGRPGTWPESQAPRGPGGG